MKNNQPTNTKQKQPTNNNNNERGGEGVPQGANIGLLYAYLCMYLHTWCGLAPLFPPQKIKVFLWDTPSEMVLVIQLFSAK